MSEEYIVKTAPGEGEVEVVDVEPHLRSRLLYTNPVCLLSTLPGLVRTSSTGGSSPAPTKAAASDESMFRPNVMTISWLTALDNRGTFVMSMNQNRHSARLLLANEVSRQHGVSL